MKWIKEDGVDEIVENVWHFKYLCTLIGSITEAGGDQQKDVTTRIVMTRIRFDNLRHVWGDKKLHLNLRLRLYKSCVCSTKMYYHDIWIRSSSTHEL